MFCTGVGGGIFLEKRKTCCLKFTENFTGLNAVV